MKKLFILLILVSCSSGVKKHFVENNHTSLQKQHEVVDSNYNYRPGWVDSPREWSRKAGEQNVVSHESVDNTIESSCSTARLLLYNKIAQMNSSINKVSSSKEIQNFHGETIERSNHKYTNKVDNTLNNIKILEEYWEKRLLKNNESVYSCAILAKVK